MKTIAELLKEDYLLGFIKYKDVYTLYLMPLAYWILNYKMYDPKYNPDDWRFVFRDNILNVTGNQTEAFLKAIGPDKISIDELNQTSTTQDNTLIKSYFLIDFDIKTVVSSFRDVEVERYLPNDEWEGLFDDPINYLPSHILCMLD